MDELKICYKCNEGDSPGNRCWGRLSQVRMDRLGIPQQYVHMGSCPQAHRIAKATMEKNNGRA